MYWIKIKSFFDKEYEGEWNGKYYDSKEPRGKYNCNLYRIYIDNKMLHIDDKAKIKIETQIKTIKIREKENEKNIDNILNCISKLINIILEIKNIEKIQKVVNKIIEIYNEEFNSDKNIKIKAENRFNALERLEIGEKLS